MTHDINANSDQIEYVEDVIIDIFLELIGEEEYFLSGSGGAQLTLYLDFIDDMLKVESRCVPFGVQVYHVEIRTMEMELDTLY